MDQRGEGAIKWTWLSCRTFTANAVRLQLHALACNIGNFPRTLATPEPIKEWSLTSLREKLIKAGANPSLSISAQERTISQTKAVIRWMSGETSLTEFQVEEKKNGFRTRLVRRRR